MSAYDEINEKLKAIGALTIDQQMQPFMKYEFHTGVKTISHVLEYVESELREALYLQNSIVLEYSGNPDKVPDDHELYDYVTGKAGALKSVYIHLKKVLT